uniref:Uncharacterized protein n=1 Tax=Chelonoidis abingdonii TaxID=106734 RepID=A0A8C0HE46_CHEAB
MHKTQEQCLQEQTGQMPTFDKRAGCREMCRGQVVMQALHGGRQGAGRAQASSYLRLMRGRDAGHRCAAWATHTCGGGLERAARASSARCPLGDMVTQILVAMLHQQSGC